MKAIPHLTGLGLFLALALSAGACRTPSAAREVPGLELETAGPEAASPVGSTLGPGDVIEVRVFQEPDLSGPFRLSPEGLIDFPLCRKIALTGATTIEASDRLTACLKKGYLKDPQVSVFLREYNSKKIFVFGEVQKPGTFPYESSMNVVQAITLAGGFTKTAAKNSCSVTRAAGGQERKIKAPVEDIGVGKAPNLLLQPGDIVFVPESFF